jgi:NAD(P)-dependent dehydrogenase (short-subunit alcohol dehydrogenase family)
VGLLDGRNALVTGAANGIGRAIAAAFVAEGARIAGVDVEDGGEAVPSFRHDLGEIESLCGLVERVEGEVGPLDVLVNCAGIGVREPSLELPLATWRRVIAVDLEAPVFLAQAAARGMVERGYGRIVNISSVHGSHGAAQHLPYDAAKAGLNAATRTLAVELAPHGILVNAVAPGYVLTRLSDPESELFQEVYVRRRKLPLARHADPAEIAAPVVWLASERNTYMTGQIVTVDGGMTATF